MDAPTNELAALIEDVHEATAALGEREGEDVARVRQLVGAMGQSFTTTMFAFQQASIVKDGIQFLSGLAEKFTGEAWVAAVAGEQLRRPINTLRTRYALKDTAAFHERASKLAPKLGGAEIIALTRALIVYYGFLLRRIRDLLPFYELGVAFEGQKIVAERVKASPKGRGVED